jgi:hypothetical protein
MKKKLSTEYKFLLGFGIFLSVFVVPGYFENFKCNQVESGYVIEEEEVYFQTPVNLDGECSVYVYHLVEADFETFEILELGPYDHYGMDKNLVYNSSFKGYIAYSGMDTSSLEFMSDYYWRDMNNVYWSGSLIKGADVETFELLEGGYAKDKDSTYFQGEIVNSQ